MTRRDLKLIREYEFSVKYDAVKNRTELYLAQYLCAYYSGEHSVEYCCLGSGNVEGFLDSEPFAEARALRDDDPRFAYYLLAECLSWNNTRMWQHPLEVLEEK